MSNNCRGVRPRIRKEVYSLTKEEQSTLRNALKQAMNNPTNGKKFQDIAAYHGAPYEICKDFFGRFEQCCPHEHNERYETFLTWHRLYLGK